jgi:hypothetical protein
MHPRRSFLLALLVSVVLACETSPSPSGPSSPPSASGAATSTQAPPDGSGGTGPAANEGDAVAAARSMIEAADPADAATLDAVDTVRFTKAGVAAARQVLETSDDPGALWAALWVYGSGASDPAPIRRLADLSDPTIATLAGATLVGFGDVAGFPALARALAQDGWLAGAHPARRMADFAALTLVTEIAPSPSAPFPDDDLAPAVYATGWMAWLDAHADALVYDPASARWHLP